MQVQPTFLLDASTLTAIGAVLGALAGTIGFLFRALVAAKDAHIAGLEKRLVEEAAAAQREVEAQRAVLLAEIQKLREDRDYFRQLLLSQSGAERRRPPA